MRHTAPLVDSINFSPVLVSSTLPFIFIQCLICLYLELRSYFNLHTFQTSSQLSDCSDHVSSLRSCFDFKLRFAALLSGIQQWEEWNLYRERSASCIPVIKSVIYEIGYIQPIQWWDFCFFFWQIIEFEISLMAYEFCPQTLLSLKSDFWPKAANLRPMTRRLTSSLAFDLWPLTSYLKPHRLSIFYSTFNSKSDFWLIIFNIWPVTYGRQPANFWLSFWSGIFDLGSATKSFLVII